VSGPNAFHSGAEDLESRDEQSAAAFERDNTWPEDEPDPSEYME